MATEKSNQQSSKQNEEKIDRIGNALQKFSEMIISRMEEMEKSKWRKGWTDGQAKFGLPQNITGRAYTGSNAFLCQIHTTMENYKVPVYLTIKQIRDAGAKIKKGEKSIPVFKWGFSIKDENGKKISEEDYRNRTKEEQDKCRVRPYLQVYNEWNIDQTTLEEVNKEKYESLLERFKAEPLKDANGMYKNEAFDRMLEKQSWVCPIEYDQVNPRAYYSPREDRIVVPRKEQFNISDTPEEVFKDGMEYYASTIHEMAHSTGHKSRLDRLSADHFGGEKYAKEELVAELTAALVGNALGFDSRIKENNTAYIKSWIGTLRKEPRFLMTVMSDVNKASKMVFEHIDEQRQLLGEKPLLEGSLDGQEERVKNEQQMANLTTKQLEATPHEDSNLQTDVAGKAKQIAASGVPMAQAEKEAKKIIDNELHKQYHEEEDIKEASEKNKQEHEIKGESSKETAKLLTHATLLAIALEQAKENGGIWMNKEQKGNAEFINTHTPITAYNNIMMNLNSDVNKYKTNVYSYYNPAKENNMPVKQNQEGMNFHWTKWDYQNAMDKNDIISKKQYDALSNEDKSFYAKHATRSNQYIYNIDQTAMNGSRHEDYVKLVKSKGITPEVKQKDTFIDFLKGYDSLQEKHPDAVIVNRVNDNYEVYRENAKAIAPILSLELQKKGPKGKEVPYVAFPFTDLDSILPKLIKARYRVAITDPITSLKIAPTPLDKEIVLKATVLAKKIAKQTNIKYEFVMVLQDAKYDQKEDKLVISGRKLKMGNESLDNIYKANDIYRSIVAAVGSPNRLDRSGRNNLLPSDDAKHEQLVRELAAGVLMARQGLPAVLSKENEKLIPYWVREIKENPKLMGIIERDVNNAVEVIDNLAAKHKVNYEAIRGQLPQKMVTGRPSYYSIVTDLGKLPNIETKEIVIIRDKVANTADVILPAGASLVVNNEVPGMSKDRIVTALKKEGIKEVSFYNASGALGLNEPNEYFQGKEVTVNKLKQYNLLQHQVIDVREQAASQKEVAIKMFRAIKDDNGRYAFFIKPENEPSFSVYPTKEHMNTFFTVIKTPNEVAVHHALAQKYYEFATKHPDVKHDLITPKHVDVDMKLIERPSITSSAQNSKQKIIFATINGQRVQAPINQQQWQKMWLANDMTAYKRALAAIIFEPMLKRDMGGENKAVKQDISEEKGKEVKEAPAPAKRQEEETRESASRGSHR